MRSPPSNCRRIRLHETPYSRNCSMRAWPCWRRRSSLRFTSGGSAASTGSDTDRVRSVDACSAPEPYPQLRMAPSPVIMVQGHAKLAPETHHDHGLGETEGVSDGTNGPQARRPRPRSATEAAPVTVRVPAKLNLYLGVGSLRPDGYHEVSTVYQALSLYDEVTAEPAQRLSVVVNGEGASDVPRNKDNLAVRAARAVASLTGVKPGVRLVIRNGIPVAGGMAGGSADAAAALVACDALWGTGLDRETLRRLGSGLGS